MFYIAAFFEASLNDERLFAPVFRAARAGRVWLPDANYLTPYEDSTDVVVADFEKDLDGKTRARGRLLLGQSREEASLDLRRESVRPGWCRS